MLVRDEVNQIVSLKIREQKHVYGVLSLHRARFPWFGLARPPGKQENSADETVQSVQLYNCMCNCVHLVHIRSRGLKIIGNGICLFLELPPFYKTILFYKSNNLLYDAYYSRCATVHVPQSGCRSPSVVPPSSPSAPHLHSYLTRPLLLTAEIIPGC